MTFNLIAPVTPLTTLNDVFLQQANIKLLVKRDDLIHHEISGNKWRKLKHNVVKANNLCSRTILTFGGAYSNHLFATASACHQAGISSIGIVRGDELNIFSSSTLRHCHAKGMLLYFVSRNEYKQKLLGKTIQSILSTNRSIFIIPEGGANEEGLQGMAEVPSEITSQLGFQPDFICVAAGTGSSAAGLLSGGANVIAFPVLKGGEFLRQDIQHMLQPWPATIQNLNLQTGYHFGGYGKYNQQLLDFIIWFEETHNIAIEQVYTGKMLYGIYDLIKKKYFQEGSTLVAMHTGGLQGRLNTLPNAPLQTDFK